MSEIKIRLATLDDVALVAVFRRAMFVDMGETDILASSSYCWLSSGTEGNLLQHDLREEDQPPS